VNALRDGDGEERTNRKPHKSLTQILAVVSVVVGLAGLVGVNCRQHAHHVLRDRLVKQTGAHGGMGGGIVYDIGPILDRIHNCAGLSGQVDLEADMIAGLRVGRGRVGCR